MCQINFRWAMLASLGVARSPPVVRPKPTSRSGTSAHRFNVHLLQQLGPHTQSWLRGGASRVRCGPATVLQPRLPPHGLHYLLSSICVLVAGTGRSLRAAPSSP